MYAWHTPGNLLQEVYCVRFRQQYLPDRGLLSCAEDPSTVYCSPATDATICLFTWLAYWFESWSPVFPYLAHLTRAKARTDPVERHDCECSQGGTDDRLNAELRCLDAPQQTHDKARQEEACRSQQESDADPGRVAAG